MNLDTNENASGWRKVLSMIFLHSSVENVIDTLKNSTSWPSPKSQIEFVRRIASHNERYPLSRKYIVHLLKRLLKQLDDKINDDFMEFVMPYLATSGTDVDTYDDKDESYFTYLIPFEASVCSENRGAQEAGHEQDVWAHQENVVLIPLRCFRGHNFVGFRAWAAGMALTELLSARPELIERKNVIELGGGVGVTGIVSAATVEMESILITDFADDIVENLKHNVSINKSHLKCDVRVEQLDWRTAACAEDVQYLYGRGNNDWADVILAADCIYSEDIHIPLVKCIETLMKARLALSKVTQQGAIEPEKGSGVEFCRQYEPMAILCCEERGITTYDHFLHVVDSTKGVEMLEITDWALTATDSRRLFPYEGRDRLRFIQIRLNLERNRREEP